MQFWHFSATCKTWLHIWHIDERLCQTPDCGCVYVTRCHLCTFSSIADVDLNLYLGVIVWHHNVFYEFFVLQLPGIFVCLDRHSVAKSIHMDGFDRRYVFR